MLDNYKVVLLGATGVGKSSLALRHTRGVFFDCCESTVGAAFLTARASLGGREVSLEIWDTAGQERYASLAPMYYRGAAGALVVYDAARPETLESAKRWVRELRANVSACSIVLVANKIDLDTGPAPSRADARAYARDEGIQFVEASAKRAVGVGEAFQRAVAGFSPEGTRPGPSAAPATTTRLATDGSGNVPETNSAPAERRRNTCKCSG
jgi:Ras-related protein Rab-5C